MLNQSQRPNSILAALATAMLTIVVTGCDFSKLKSEVREAEASDDSCSALKVLDTRVSEFGEKKSYWKLWLQVAHRCYDENESPQWMLGALNQAHDNGLPVNRLVNPLLASSLVSEVKTPLNDDDYSLEVEVPSFVESVELLGMQVATTDGKAKFTIPQASVSGDKVAASMEFKLGVLGDSVSFSTDVAFPTPQLRTDNEVVTTCTFYASHNGTRNCLLSLRGAPSTEFLLVVEGRVTHRCTVAPSAFGCTIDAPAILLTGFTTLYASRAGYQDEDLPTYITYEVYFDDVREFEAHYCPNNSCTVSFRELEADPGYYRSRLVKYSGRVSELQRDERSNFMRVATGSYGSNDLVAAWIGDRFGITRGSSVTVYGFVADPFTYKTVAGWNRTIPRVRPVAIRLGSRFHLIP